MASPTQWDEKQISQILTLLALNAGNVAKTIREFKEEHDRAPSADTLTNWRDRKYAERYNRIREDYAREFEADAVRTLRDRMKQAAEAESIAIQKTIEALERQDRMVNPAQAAYNMTRVKATNADRLLTLTGRPNQIIDDRSAQKIIEGLVRKKVLRVVQPDDTTAEDDRESA
jgi:hypothetical protein